MERVCQEGREAIQVCRVNSLAEHRDAKSQPQQGHRMLRMRPHYVGLFKMLSRAESLQCSWNGRYVRTEFHQEFSCKAVKTGLRGARAVTEQLAEVL